jgi:hypothetical protein
MALIANVSFSKKVPVEGQQFSSQGYSLSLQTEITETEPAAIQTKLHQTFELVKSQVEHELANGNGNGKPKQESGHTPTQPPVYHRKADTAKASNRQIKYLTDLWTQGGGQISDLNARIRQDYGVQGMYELDKKQASDLLDQLQKESKKAA